MLGVVRGTDIDAGNALLDSGGTVGGAGTGLVVVVDDVDIHALATIASVSAPIIDDVVAQVHALVGLCARTRTQTGRTRRVVYHEVVVVRSSTAAPVATIAVIAFGMARIHQTLRGDTPLHGDVARAIDGEALVDTPADGTVVDNNVLPVHSTQSVALVSIRIRFQRLVAQTEAHVADDDVLVERDGIVGYADAVAGCRLSGQRGVFTDTEGRLEHDGSANVEHDGARATLGVGPTQRTLERGLAVVLQRGDVIHLATASAGGEAPEALGSGESQLSLRLCRSCHAAQQQHGAA